jgi:hypothetical protein
VVAILVLGFGGYRIWLGLRGDPPPDTEHDPAPPSRSLLAGSFYRMGKRTHLFIGTIYVLLGAALIATAFGFNPLSALTGGGDTATPTDKPTSVPMRIDHLPPPPAQK